MISNFTSLRKDQSGVATIESAILLPIMLGLLFGLYDIGQAIIINQKVTAASHMAADLITRKTVINDTDFNDAVGVAHLVIDPYDRSLLGIDIVGIEYGEDDTPEEIWRHTVNMDENVNLPASADDLGVECEGIVAISTTYTYTPKFLSPLSGELVMEETAFLRGRKTSLVRYEEDN
jgi:Flp pilus assembly protein TadG